MTDITYRTFTKAEWTALPKKGFDTAIRSWCNIHGFMEYVDIGRPVPAKLPYKTAGENIECAEDFLHMAERAATLASD